ncbi:hypothetical protein BD847_1393 [Flavobacterium cutihirudinis]|uniref:Uncharacterized protein n=1 Tax=Flavobacterium cutihirudinis TaxID=1265740 RepID=A0A3D9FVG9_9FLAO|nr:hypothetical protein BD847_1393 [Flavobacterium cutihirudinis]
MNCYFFSVLEQNCVISKQKLKYDFTLPNLHQITALKVRKLSVLLPIF